MNWRRILVLAMAMSLFAAACGSGGDSTTEGASSDVQTGEQESSEQSGDSDDTATGNSGDDEYESPLGEYLGFTEFGGSDEDSQATFEAEERERQESIASCMRAQGFEYTPTDPSRFDFFDEIDEGEEWGSEAWVRKWGFGISTMMFSEAQVGDGAVGSPDYFSEGVGVGPEEDPNFAYMDSLSDAERVAYEKALWGDFPDLGPDATDEEWQAAYENFEPSGCEADTYSDEETGDEFYSEFGEELDAMWEAAQSDPRWIEVRAEVERCVTDKGQQYLDEEGQYEYFDKKLSALQEAIWGMDAFGDEAMTDEEYEAMTDEELEAQAEQYRPPVLTAEQNAELKAVQDEEIAMAVAEFECGGSWQQQEELFNDLRIEYEQRFIDENAAALEAFKASQDN